MVTTKLVINTDRVIVNVILVDDEAPAFDPGDGLRLVDYIDGANIGDVISEG